jgi:alpha-D-ribose 1-methylphosphonate 5-triphosphate synthase subunit PhnH
MSAMNLATLGAGFSDLARGSQAVFRSVLSAFSYPGTCVKVVSDAEVPDTARSASALVLLALLDAETSLWLSPGLAGTSAAHWLRFHTGCTVVDSPEQAQFMWVAHLDELPDLAQLCTGTDISPELSVTCLIDVPALSTVAQDQDWELTGPGIQDKAYLTIEAVTPSSRARFLQQQHARQALFPRGVDIVLATSHGIVGLPRTTQISPSGV